MSLKGTRSIFIKIKKSRNITALSIPSFSLFFANIEIPPVPFFVAWFCLHFRFRNDHSHKSSSKVGTCGSFESDDKVKSWKVTVGIEIPWRHVASHLVFAIETNTKGDDESVLRCPTKNGLWKVGLEIYAFSDMHIRTQIRHTMSTTRNDEKKRKKSFLFNLLIAFDTKRKINQLEIFRIESKKNYRKSSNLLSRAF